MKILAYQTDRNLNPTGLERILEAKSKRWACSFLQADIPNSRISGSGFVLFETNGNCWFFQYVNH